MKGHAQEMSVDDDAQPEPVTCPVWGPTKVSPMINQVDNQPTTKRNYLKRTSKDALKHLAKKAMKVSRPSTKWANKYALEESPRRPRDKLSAVKSSPKSRWVWDVKSQVLDFKIKNEPVVKVGEALSDE